MQANKYFKKISKAYFLSKTQEYELLIVDVLFYQHNCRFRSMPEEIKTKASIEIPKVILNLTEANKLVELLEKLAVRIQTDIEFTALSYRAEEIKLYRKKWAISANPKPSDDTNARLNRQTKKSGTICKIYDDSVCKITWYKESSTQKDKGRYFTEEHSLEWGDFENYEDWLLRNPDMKGDKNSYRKWRTEGIKKEDIPKGENEKLAKGRKNYYN